MMTDTEVHVAACSARRGRGTSTRPIAEAMYANIENGRPAAVERGRPDAGARRCSSELKVPESGLATEAQPAARPRVIPDEEKRGGGSDDIGDISWNVPTVTLRYPVEHPGRSRPQLGERDLDGDADRAQGRHRRREGAWR